MFNYDDPLNYLSTLKNGQYILQFFELVDKRVKVNELVDVVSMRRLLGSRGEYSVKYNTVFLDPYTPSFQPNYKGVRYKTFGGVVDLTPGGVLCHELGHSLTRHHPRIINAFRTIRITHPKSVSSYGTKYLHEDIAECFRLYCTNSKLLLSVFPERYEALDKYGRRYIL